MVSSQDSGYNKLVRSREFAGKILIAPTVIVKGILLNLVFFLGRRRCLFEKENS